MLLDQYNVPLTRLQVEGATQCLMEQRFAKDFAEQFTAQTIFAQCDNLCNNTSIVHYKHAISL
jgi:hypothetical protein